MVLSAFDPRTDKAINPYPADKPTADHFADVVFWFYASFCHDANRPNAAR